MATGSTINRDNPVILFCVKCMEMHVCDHNTEQQSLITKEGITLTEVESSDMNTLLTDVSEKINGIS